MRKVRFLLTALLPALLLPTPVLAGMDDYVCRIIDVREVQPDGSSTTFAFWLEAAQQQPMTIDRMSGRVIHSMFGNAVGDNQVLERGSTEQSFKLLSRFGLHGGFLSVNYYEVDEFDVGSDKKLRLMSSQWLVTGTCQ